jgi:hypothetical protein
MCANSSSTGNWPDTPGFSRDTAPTIGESGSVTDRHGAIHGYTVTIASFAAKVDGARCSKR